MSHERLALYPYVWCHDVGLLSAFVAQSMIMIHMLSAADVSYTCRMTKNFLWQ